MVVHGVRLGKTSSVPSIPEVHRPSIGQPKSVTLHTVAADLRKVPVVELKNPRR
jgi:hypothetical protein